MSKATIIYYLSLMTICIACLVYSLIIGNSFGAVFSFFSCAFQALGLIFSILDSHQKKKHLEQEVQNWLEYFQKEN